MVGPGIGGRAIISGGPRSAPTGLRLRAWGPRRHGVAVAHVGADRGRPRHRWAGHIPGGPRSAPTGLRLCAWPPHVAVAYVGADRGRPGHRWTGHHLGRTTVRPYGVAVVRMAAPRCRCACRGRPWSAQVSVGGSYPAGGPRSVPTGLRLCASGPRPTGLRLRAYGPTVVGPGIGGRAISRGRTTVRPHGVTVVRMAAPRCRCVCRGRPWSARTSVDGPSSRADHGPPLRGCGCAHGRPTLPLRM